MEHQNFSKHTAKVLNQNLTIFLNDVLFEAIFSSFTEHVHYTKNTRARYNSLGIGPSEQQKKKKTNVKECIIIGPKVDKEFCIPETLNVHENQSAGTKSKVHERSTSESKVQVVVSLFALVS